MEKCNNEKCPMKERCRRYTAKQIGPVSEKTFQFETIKNPDGTIRGHICQFQKYV